MLELAHKYEVLDLIPPVCEAMVEQLTIDTAVPFVHVLRLLEGSIGPEEVQLQEGNEVQEPEAFGFFWVCKGEKYHGNIKVEGCELIK